MLRLRHEEARVDNKRVREKPVSRAEENIMRSREREKEEMFDIKSVS